MITPPRILRDQADRLFSRKFHFSARQKDRETRILLAAEHFFAKHGFASVTFSNLALALAISPAALRQHFVDLDQLLGAILQNHLFSLTKTLVQITGTGDSLYAARRKAWFDATRAMGALTDAHKLLIRERHNLPEDLREEIGNAYDALGEWLAPDDAPQVLALLDAEIADLPVIEAWLTAPLTKPAPKATRPGPVLLPRQNPVPATIPHPFSSKPRQPGQASHGPPPSRPKLRRCEAVLGTPPA
jgi:AcrR family transcriptional regulator